jgi:hypothetical protein
MQAGVQDAKRLHKKMCHRRACEVIFYLSSELSHVKYALCCAEDQYNNVLAVD